MIPTDVTYTTQVLPDATYRNLISLSGEYSGFEDILKNTSCESVLVSLRVAYPRPNIPIYPESYKESFIGILTNEEVRRMKNRLNLFRKRFNEDLARRHKILFRE